MKWQIRQLEKISEMNPDRIDTLMAKLFEEDAELHEETVVGAYLDGDINFGKAAEFLRVDPVALRQQFLQRGIPVRIGLESLEDLQAEINAAEQFVNPQ